MRIPISLALLLSFSWVTLAANPREVVLTIGDSFIAKGSGGLRAQKSEAIQLAPIAGGLQILAKKSGSSRFFIGSKEWEIQVLTPAQRKTRDLLRKWTQARLGLSVRVEESQVKLRGKLLRAEDWLDLASLCRDCQYSAEISINPEIKSDVDGKLRLLLSQRGLPNPSLRWSPQGEWLISKSSKSQNLLNLSRRLGLNLNIDEEVIDPAPLVKTQIYVMEVRREKTRQWGLDWPESITTQVIPKLQSPLSSLSLSAHALEKTGEAKILASPALLCRSGQEAEFLAGGEFPIKVFSKTQSGVVWRKYGILVRVKPKADRFGKISMSLETEVSNIDGARVVDGIPGLLTNRVLSHFDLSGGQTIAISGLIRNDESESVKGLPGLSQIPILGNLFSSKEFRENRSELVILVKPETLNLSAGNL